MVGAVFDILLTISLNPNVSLADGVRSGSSGVVSVGRFPSVSLVAVR